VLAAPVATQDLQIRVDGKIVFSQPVEKNSFDLGFRGGNLTVTAAIVGAEESDAASAPIMVPLDSILASAPPVHDEDAPNPNVLLNIHSGNRPGATPPDSQDN
jgi:hypothetical protein